MRIRHVVSRRRKSFGVVAAAALAVAAVSPSALACVSPHHASPHHASPHHASPHASSKPSHIFVIMMENHSATQVIDNPVDAPYLTALAKQANVATNYRGVTHPSLPNYLATISGSFQGIFDDCKAGPTVTCPPEEFVPDSGDGTDSASLTPAQKESASKTPHWFTGRNLIDQLQAHHLTWKAYMNDMPANDKTVTGAGPTVNGTTINLYVQKHNPFLYFSDIQNSPARMKNIVPGSQLTSDLARGNLARFVWISPNLCEDMHGIPQAKANAINQPKCGDSEHGAVQVGDAYIKNVVRQITSSKVWKTTNSSLVLVWDENDYNGYSGGPGSPVGANNVVLGGGSAPLLVLNSRHTGRHLYRAVADHYTLLATIQKLWNLGCLANTCSTRTSGTFLNLFH